MWRLYIGLVVGGILLAGYGIREFTLGKDSSPEPEAITAEELESGVPTNPHRRLGPHVAILENVIIMERKRSGSSSVDYAYYPVVSNSAWFAMLAKLGINDKNMVDFGPVIQKLPIKVIVKTRRWTTPAAISTESMRPDSLYPQQLVGMVTNRIESLGTKEIELLRQVTPNFDPATTVILEEGRTPTGAGVAIAIIAAGVSMAVAPVLIWLIARARRSGEVHETEDDPVNQS